MLPAWRASATSTRTTPPETSRPENYCAPFQWTLDLCSRAPVDALVRCFGPAVALAWRGLAAVAIVFVLATPPRLERLAITERPVTQNLDFRLFAHNHPDWQDMRAW